jgi:hypothetical protein
LDLLAAFNIVFGRVDVTPGMQTHVHAAHDLTGPFGRVMFLENLHLELQILFESGWCTHAEFGVVEFETDINDALDG